MSTKSKSELASAPKLGSSAPAITGKKKKSREVEASEEKAPTKKSGTKAAKEEPKAPKKKKKVVATLVAPAVDLGALVASQLDAAEASDAEQEEEEETEEVDDSDLPESSLTDGPEAMGDEDLDAEGEEDEEEEEEEAEENTTSLVVVYKEECVKCTHLIASGEKAYSKCHFSNGNDNCPAKSMRIVVGLPIVETAAKLANFKVNGEVIKYGKLLERLQRYDDIILAQVCEKEIQFYMAPETIKQHLPLAK